MAKLEWDAVGDRLYETGVKNGVLYLQEGNTYLDGVPWNGLTGFSESPDGGEANDIYADDIKYLSIRSRENFKGTITAYTYPDEFAQCDGSDAIMPGVFLSQQTRSLFGLSYITTLGNDNEFDDYGYKIHLVYGATASPSSKDYKTINDSPEAIEFSWEIDTVPVNIEGYKPIAHIEIDSTKLNAFQLKKLEDILYGTSSSDAHLPLPNELIDVLTMPNELTGNPVIINNINNYYSINNFKVELLPFNQLDQGTPSPTNPVYIWEHSSNVRIINSNSSGSQTYNIEFPINDMLPYDLAGATVDIINGTYTHNYKEYRLNNSQITWEYISHENAHYFTGTIKRQYMNVDQSRINNSICEVATYYGTIDSYDQLPNNKFAFVSIGVEPDDDIVFVLRCDDYISVQGFINAVGSRYIMVPILGGTVYEITSVDIQLFAGENVITADESGDIETDYKVVSVFII